MDLYYENNKLARVRVAGMSGSSGIGFFRLVANLEFTFTSRDDDVTLFPLTGRLAVGNRNVGHLFSPAAELTKAAPRDYPDTKVLYIDLDRPRIDALEAIRNGGALTLDVHVAGQVISNQHGLCSLRDASDSYQLNQTGWIDILRQMGYGETMLIEVPVTDGIGKTTEYLAAAQKAVGLGHYREAVGACRDVLEAVSMGVGDGDERDPDFTPLFANTRNKDKQARLRVLRQALKILTHPARHVDEVAVLFDWNREDAVSAIAATAALLRWQAAAK